MQLSRSVQHCFSVRFHKNPKNNKFPLYNFSLIKYNATIKKPNMKGTTIMKKIFALALAAMLLMSCFAGCTPETKPLVNVGYTIYSPMNYNDEAGNLVGFDTELAKAVFEALGYEVKFKEIEWTAKYTNLNSGDIDCVWNGFTCNTSDNDGVARADKVDFSYKYMENRQIVIVKSDAAVTSLADLAGKRAAVEKGSAGEEFANDIQGAIVKTATKQTDCLMEVMSGTADFAVVDALLAASYVGKGDYANLKIVEALSGDIEYYAIGFKKDSALTAKVNEQLEKLAADGTIAKLAEKYNVSATVITNFADQK